VIVDNKITIGGGAGPQLLINIFKGNQWGSAFGRSTLVTKAHRPGLFERMAELKKHGIVKDMFDMDVKDLLETRRIVIEKQALDTILKAHTSDIGPKHTMTHAALLVARAQRNSGLVEKLNEVAEMSPETDPNEEHLDELDDILDLEENAGIDGPRI
jgi:arginine/lysine/ornithine decarboxylase